MLPDNKENIGFPGSKFGVKVVKALKARPFFRKIKELDFDQCPGVVQQLRHGRRRGRPPQLEQRASCLVRGREAEREACLFFSCWLPLSQRIVFSTRQGHAAALKNYHLRDARVYFTGWAISFAPFLFLTQPRVHVLHHYFPSLYFAILVACSVFSGITAFLPRGARLALHIGFIALVAGMFARLMAITYGTPMDVSQCRSLDQWLAKTIKLGQTTSSFLDCSFDSPSDKSASVLAPHVGKAVSVEKRPVLKAHYHHPDHELPYQDAYYLMPFQRPPQQWRRFQKAKPDVHQIQMLKGRLGQNFDWMTHTEDRMKFQRWIEQDGMDPWADQRRAEEEMARKKLEEEQEQRVLMENRRSERRRIKKEKIRAEEEQKRAEEEQKRAEEEQNRAEDEQTGSEEEQKHAEE